jgi:hypothetical protein
VGWSCPYDPQYYHIPPFENGLYVLKRSILKDPTVVWVVRGYDCIETMKNSIVIKYKNQTYETFYVTLSHIGYYISSKLPFYTSSK